MEADGGQDSDAVGVPPATVVEDRRLGRDGSDVVVVTSISEGVIMGVAASTAMAEAGVRGFIAVNVEEGACVRGGEVEGVWQQRSSSVGHVGPRMATMRR